MARGDAARAWARLQWRQREGGRDPRGEEEWCWGMDREDPRELIPGLASARRRPGRRTGAWPRRRRLRPPPAPTGAREGTSQGDGPGQARRQVRVSHFFFCFCFSVLLTIVFQFISAPKQKVKTILDLLKYCYNIPNHFQSFQHFWKFIVSNFKFQIWNQWLFALI